ncbi:MAG: hypothetical protein LBS36_11745, partial [Oscillospiraceae bacterium]|nr:hypothetical protein [Oscillospiraceae bacterium]
MNNRVIKLFVEPINQFRNQSYRYEKYIPILFGVIVFLVYFIFSLQYTGPAYLSDEIGYLSKAAAIAGFPVDVASSWQAGYSILLAPLFILFSDPFIIWKGVLFLNAIMFGLSFIILFYLLRQLDPGKSTWQIIFTMAICAFYPAFITMSGYAFSSPAAILCFMLILMTLTLSLHNSESLLWHFINALLVGYFNWIHPTGLSIAAVYIMMLLIIRGEKAWVIATKIAIVVFMIIAYKIGIHPWLNSIMTPKGYSAGNHYGSITSFLQRLLSNWRFLLYLPIVVLGQFSYFIVASFGLVNVLIYDLYSLYTQIRRKDSMLSRQKRNSFVIMAFICASFFGIIVMGSISFTYSFKPGKELAVSYLLYGRYAEVVFLPILAYGLSFFNIKRVRELTFYSLLISGYIFFQPFIVYLQQFNWVNVPAYWPLILCGATSPLFYIAICGITIICLINILNRKFIFAIAMIILYSFCVSAQIKHHLNILKTHSNPSDMVRVIRNDVPRNTLIAYDVDDPQFKSFSSRLRERFRMYSFYFYDYNFRRMTAVEWDSTQKGLYLTYFPEKIDKSTDILLAKENAGLFLVAKKTSADSFFKRDQEKFTNLRGIEIKKTPNQEDGTLYNVYLNATELPTRVGIRSGDSLYTNKQGGFLSYGPYLAFPRGEYRLTIYGHAENIDEAVVDIYSSNEKRIINEFRIKYKKPSEGATGNGIFLQEVFVLSENIDDLEARIKVGENDVVRFDSLAIEWIDSDDKGTINDVRITSDDVRESGIPLDNVVDLSMPDSIKIKFGKDGNDSNYLRDGFGGPENGFRWTDKDRAELTFFVVGKDSASGDITVSMDVFPLTRGNLKAQRVEIFIDGEKSEDWSIDKPMWKELKLPAKPDDSSYSIEFRLPDATTPKSLGINDDMRLLGIAFREIQFTTADISSDDKGTINDVRITSDDV